jgi:hypothetical protein
LANIDPGIVIGWQPGRPGGLDMDAVSAAVNP